MKKLIEQIVKFGVIGVIATIVDWGIYAVLVPIHGANSGLSGGMDIKTWETVCAVISFSVSVVVNYIGSMKYVFERRDDMSRVREFTIFLILSIIAIMPVSLRKQVQILSALRIWPVF